MKQGIKQKHIDQFVKTCEKLKKVMEEIQEYNPDAHMFCNMDDLELHGIEYKFDDDFHNADAVAKVYIPGTSCGER